LNVSKAMLTIPIGGYQADGYRRPPVARRQTQSPAATLSPLDRRRGGRWRGTVPADRNLSRLLPRCCESAHANCDFEKKAIEQLSNWRRTNPDGLPRWTVNLRSFMQRRATVDQSAEAQAGRGAVRLRQDYRWLGPATPAWREEARLQVHADDGGLRPHFKSSDICGG
jgi:hypothetical protein